MRFLKLRIAWSVALGIAAVLLIALWVQSFKNFNVTYFGPRFGSVIVVVDSRPGVLGIGAGPIGTSQPWSVRRIDKAEITYVSPSYSRMWAIYRSAVCVPYWFATLFFTVLATLPWFRWRFSLRTLLIATTLVAVVLGLIVWLL